MNRTRDELESVNLALTRELEDIRGRIDNLLEDDEAEEDEDDLEEDFEDEDVDDGLGPFEDEDLS